jgi:ABC-type maltose transport system permease subunit
MAAALLMTLPVAAIFFTFQRHIVLTGEGATKE